MKHHRVLLRSGLAVAMLFGVTITGSTFDPAAVDGEVEIGSVDNRIELTLTNPSKTLPAVNPFLEIVTTPQWLQITSVEGGDHPLAPGDSRSYAVVFAVADDAEPGADGVLEVAFGADFAFFDQPPVQIHLGVVAPADDTADCQIDHEHAVPDWSGPEKHDVYVFRDHQSREILRVLVFSGPVEATFDLALQSSHDERFGPFSSLADAETKAREYCDDTLEDSEAPGGAPPVLQLVAIDRRGDGGPDGRTPGGALEQHGFLQEAELDEILSAGLEGVPATIIAGTTVRFQASALRSVRYADGSFCFPWDPEPDSNVVALSLDVRGSQSVEAEVHGAVGMSNYCRGNLKRKVEWSGGGRYYSNTNVVTDTAQVTVELVPTDSERIERNGELHEVAYHYRATVTGGATLLQPDSAGEIVLIRQRYRTDARGHAVDPVPSGSAITVSLYAPSITNGHGASTTLRYEPVQAGVNPLAPAEYQHPEPFPPTPAGAPDETRLVDGQGVTGDPGVAGSDTVAEPTGIGTPTGSGSAGDQAADGGRAVPPHRPGTGPGAQGPTGGRSLDPNAPDIAALIAAWIGQAEPPENALDGAELRYTGWGQKVGRTTGGVITARGRPDDVGARSSSEYLWALRNQLDSVDHCTLGEYVTARLDGAGIARCAGRYRGAVGQLTGRTRSAAEAAVRRLKHVPVATDGDPAPSADLAGTVQLQDPAPGTRLDRGEQVRLWVYTEPQPTMVTVPDLVGRSRRLASTWIDELGLTVELRNGGPAPSANQEATIARHAPPAETRVAPGSRVTLYVFGPPQPTTPPAWSPPSRPPAPPTSVNCSQWPGSVPVTSGRDQRCECPAGTSWNATGTGCVTASTANSDQQHCDRAYPGTIAQRSASGQLECQCPAGLGWDGARGGCVAATGVAVQPVLPSTHNCRQMPGTIATRDPASGRVTCRCPVGTWDSSQRRCVTDQPERLDPPSCTADYAWIRADVALGNFASARAKAEQARQKGCSSTFVSNALGPAGRTTMGGTGRTVGSTSSGGTDCESLGRSLSEPLFQNQITRQQAEQQMVAAGCGDQLDTLCPWGNFGQSAYPDCIGHVVVGPGPAGTGPAAGRGPTCYIEERFEGRGGPYMLFEQPFPDFSHTNYWIMPGDDPNSISQALPSSVGFRYLLTARSFNAVMQQARQRCSNPTPRP